MEEDDPLAAEVSIQAHLDESGIKVQTRSRLVASLDRILGNIVDIPSTYLEGISRRRRTKMEISDQLERSLGQVRIEGATELERLRQRANLHAEDLKIRQQLNRENIAIVAIEDLRDNNPELDEGGTLSDDWLNKFTTLSGDASSEEMQLLFGKILSGEIRKPGAFSLSTLRTVSELTQDLAEDFAWAWGKSIGFELWLSHEFNSGEPWTKLRNLRDAGLLSPVDSAIHQPQFNPVSVPQLSLNNGSLWQIGPHTDTFLWVAMTRQLNVRLNVVNFTRIGVELGQILPSPDYEHNLRSLAQGFPKTGVDWIRLRRGAQEEVLWQSS